MFYKKWGPFRKLLLLRLERKFVTVFRDSSKKSRNNGDIANIDHLSRYTTMSRSTVLVTENRHCDGRPYLDIFSMFACLMFEVPFCDTAEQRAEFGRYATFFHETQNRTEIVVVVKTSMFKKVINEK